MSKQKVFLSQLYVFMASFTICDTHPLHSAQWAKWKVERYYIFDLRLRNLQPDLILPLYFQSDLFHPILIDLL